MWCTQYEEALDELERDHDDKMHTATLEARRACEAEHSMTLADYAKCRENESRCFLQSNVALAVVCMN